MPDLRELLTRPAAAAELTPDEAVAALIDLLALQAVLASRARGVAVPPPEPIPADDWVTPDEAARLGGVTRRVIYGWSRCRDWSRFTARPSRKVLRIKRGAFLGWLESTGRGGGRT